MSKLISKSDRIFIAGHKGMAGSAILRNLKNRGYTNLITANRSVLDLEDQDSVRSWFAKFNPDVVVLAAAKVGGIHANNSLPADFILKNLKMQTNVIEASWKCNVKRFLFLGSSCIYPKDTQQPIREEYLLNGQLEDTNQWYAIAKISGLKLCQALQIQFGFDAISLMPTNLYGPGDNYHKTHSHVMAALIRRFYEATKHDHSVVSCWGSGKPRREFLHADDLGSAACFALENWKPKVGDLNHLNVGTGTDIEISQLASEIASQFKYNGRIEWDSSMPDGVSKKLLDITRLTNIGWKPRIHLEEGISATVDSFASEIANGTARL